MILPYSDVGGYRGWGVWPITAWMGSAQEVPRG